MRHTPLDNRTKMRYTQRADAGAKAAAAGSSDIIIVSAAALFVNLESHKNMMEEAGMEKAAALAARKAEKEKAKKEK